ncbi:hypothetical protein [Microvirga roseola]|uniref:hypothetical protein n=1 Tax=Microvirga roseola TaxID=2883126 RepID=UPI001E3286AE|nr:hypothetical protein [Microvirga roseola]
MSGKRANTGRSHRLLLFMAGGTAAAVASLFLDADLLESWLFGYVLLAGLATGALGLLMIGHLLGGYWLTPVRNELEAAALTMPLVAVLAIPIAFGLDQVFPWAAASGSVAIPQPREIYFEPTFLLVRSAVYLAIWIVLALWVARPGEHRARSSIGLVFLVPTVTLAAVDWVMSRNPEWWSSLFGTVFAITQLLPALAGAVLLTLVRPDQPDRKRLRSMERALITLALLILWLWFVQFLIIWMANLPDEVTWYIVRHSEWGWVKLWVVLPALIIGVVALLPAIVGGKLLRLGVVLLLVQHVGHMLWLVNPDVNGPLWPGLIVLAVMIALWALWLASDLRERPNVPQGAGEPA